MQIRSGASRANADAIRAAKAAEIANCRHSFNESEFSCDYCHVDIDELQDGEGNANG